MECFFKCLKKEFCLFVFWLPWVAHGVPESGIISELQLWPMLHLWQHQILNSFCWAADQTCILVLQRYHHSVVPQQKFLGLTFFCFFDSLALQPWHMEGSNGSCSRWPTPQPQQCQIQATSVTYTTAHGNARPLTRWSRPGIKPVSSWILVGFINHWAIMGIPKKININFLGLSSKLS